MVRQDRAGQVPGDNMMTRKAAEIGPAEEPQLGATRTRDLNYDSAASCLNRPESSRPP
jgi:hypothetical protein